MIVQSKHNRAGMSALTSGVPLIGGCQLKPWSPGLGWQGETRGVLCNMVCAGT